MNPFITKTIPPTTIKTQKPICHSYTKAYDVLFIQQTKQCALILLVVAAFTTTCLESIQFVLPSWRTLFHTLILWISMVILLLYRLISSSFERHVGPTLKNDLLTAVTQRQNTIRIMVYTFTSIVLVVSSFLLLFRTTIPNNILKQRLGAQQINLERLFVLIYGCLLGLSFSIYRNFTQRWVIRMQVVKQPPYYLMKSYLRSSLQWPLLWTLWSFAGSYVLYILFSGVFYKLATHFVGIFTTVLDAPVIGFRWWGVTLFIQMIMIGFSIVWNWTVMDMMVDTYFDKVDDCITPYSNPIDCLMNGLQQKNNKDKQLRVRAFAELEKLSSTDPVKRKMIYNDMDMDGTTWSRIRTECMTTLDEYMERINNEYKVDKKKQDDMNKTTTTTKPIDNKKKRIQLVDGNVMAQRQQNVTQLDDRTFHAVSEAASQVSDRLPSPDIHVGHLITSGWTWFLESKIGKSIAATRFQGPVGQWLHYLLDESKNRKMAMVLGDPAVEIYSIETLSNLVTYSLKEDDLGHVQYDLSTIINTLLRFVSTIHTYADTPPPHYMKLSDIPDVSLLALYQLDLALTNAISTIKFTFIDHLESITVDNKYLSSWNEL